jgi:D-3-phosphoglycerate dehydrogenase / 2-oxoglutarate reductase
MAPWSPSATILGEHSINIANFALGRANSGKAHSQRVPQGQALAVVQIDVPSTTSANPAIEALRKVEAIASVRLIELGKL